jgi:hypothetical protein
MYPALTNLKYILFMVLFPNQIQYLYFKDRSVDYNQKSECLYIRYGKHLPEERFSFELEQVNL